MKFGRRSLPMDGGWPTARMNRAATRSTSRASPEAAANGRAPPAGAAPPRGGGDGQELFYRAAGGKLMAVPVRSGESFEAGAAVPLFEFLGRNYAVTGDGQRFLLDAMVETEAAVPLTVVVNWAAELKR